jgi:CO/xanthine dehydrogenase FAD-binding subunit
MNFRLLRPAHLVDLNGVRDLSYLRVENGELRIGATTRQRQLERSSDVANGWPLLREATGYIGHMQIRNRGTVGGSLAHAFPSAELPMAMVTLGASLVLSGKARQRTVSAEDFFLSTMTTVLEPGELLTEIRVPMLPANTGWSYQEVSRRHGDFALAGSAALVRLDPNGNIDHARLTVTGVTPIQVMTAEEIVMGQKPSEALFRNAVVKAMEGLEQDSDIHASAEYRRSVCAALGERTLREAAERAAESSKGGTQ